MVPSKTVNNIRPIKNSHLYIRLQSKLELGLFLKNSKKEMT